ncbi:unnamed protein product [Caretta caretta]
MPPSLLHCCWQRRHKGGSSGTYFPPPPRQISQGRPDFTVCDAFFMVMNLVKPYSRGGTVALGRANSGRCWDSGAPRSHSSSPQSFSLGWGLGVSFLTAPNLQ